MKELNERKKKPNNNEKLILQSIDEAVSYVGEYGRFQMTLNAVFCFMVLPPVLQIMMMYFAADSPDWKCAQNSTMCTRNGTFKKGDPFRCGLDRGDWEFTEPKGYSMVTQFDIYCEHEWILELTVSIFFVGWIMGAVVLGWVSDNYGRKPVMFGSIVVVIAVGSVSSFLPVPAFIFCRFIIGFCVPGTYQTMVMLITEIVGPKYRAFAGNIIFVFVTTTFAILGLKAYFIREWRLLHIVCSAPYVVVLLFYKFVPDSLRTLHQNGKNEELMRTLHRMAEWNGRPLPPNVTIASANRSNALPQKTNPLDLVRSRKLAKLTFCQALGYIVGGMTFYGLYLAAGDIGGSMYRDYLILTVSEIPFALCAVPLCDYFGRKKTCMSFYFIGALSCFGLCFAPRTGSAKISRILLGMLGKCSVGAGYNTLNTWTVELYPTSFRGYGMGFLQVLTRMGAALAPWVDREFNKLNPSSPFIFFGVLTFVSLCLLPPLKEMKGQRIGESEGEGEANNVAELELENDGGKTDVSPANNGSCAVNELYNELHKDDKDNELCNDFSKEGLDTCATNDMINAYRNCVDLTDEALDRRDSNRV